MKKMIYRNWVWLLAAVLLICLIPAAHIIAKTVEAQEAETVFFYVTVDSGGEEKDVLLRAAPIAEIRALSHSMEGEKNYAVSSLDSLPTTCYAEAKGFTTAELIAYLNSYRNEEFSEMGALTYGGEDRLSFMADDSIGWTRTYTAAKLDGVERKYVEGLYEGWDEYGYDWFEDDEDIADYKEQAWAEGEPMPAILSTLSNSGRTTTNVSETSDGILEFVLANSGTPRGCLGGVLATDKALTLYIPSSEEQFMTGAYTCSENFKWIYAIRLKMADPPAFQSKGTVPAARPSYELIEGSDEILLKVTLSSPMDDAVIYYNDGQDSGSSAQTRYENPFTIDVTGRDLATNPVKYYTRTVREGYDDLGPLTMQYYQLAPTFMSVSAGSLLGEDVLFEAQAKVTPEEWSDWSGSLERITLKYPDGTPRVLAATEYSINDAEKTITLDKDLFHTTGSHSLTLEAAGYAVRSASRTMKGDAPGIAAAEGYPLYEDIVLIFDDPTGAYQSNITAKIDGQNVAATYLDRTEPGRLTIRASYFATGALGEPGEYSLSLTNSNYLPNVQTLILKLTPALAGEEPVCREGVYLLADAADLFWFAKQVNVKGLKEIAGRLTGDIDLEDAPWTPIGPTAAIFYAGVFDGAGFQISGLQVNSEDNYQGLFGYIKEATIRNLTVSGEVNGKGWLGGIAGQAMGATIEHCVNKAAVQGTVNIGGIAGFATMAGVIEGCTNKGTINGTQYVGGICGQTASTAIVQSCLNLGQISGGNRVGGICGANAGFREGLSVDRCVNSGAVSADENNVGGIAGYAQRTVSNCYNTGAVLGKKSDPQSGIGGIAGLLFQDGIVNCYNTGAVGCSADGAETPVGAVVGLWQTDNKSAGNYYLANGLGGIGSCKYPESAPDETEGKSSEEMKALAPVLGEAYAEDSFRINSGYPVLDWQFAIAGANQEAADAVSELIEAIGEVGADDASGGRIAAAREAFERLIPEQQSLVSNEAALLAAEEAHAAAVEGLAAAKAAAMAELERYRDPSDYRQPQQAELLAAVAAGMSAIGAAADLAGVDQALAGAKAALDSLKTDAQLTAAELAAAKTAVDNSETGTLPETLPPAAGSGYFPAWLLLAGIVLLVRAYQSRKKRSLSP